MHLQFKPQLIFKPHTITLHSLFIAATGMPTSRAQHRRLTTVLWPTARRCSCCLQSRGPTCTRRTRSAWWWRNTPARMMAFVVIMWQLWPSLLLMINFTTIYSSEIPLVLNINSMKLRINWDSAIIFLENICNRMSDWSVPTGGTCCRLLRRASAYLEEHVARGGTLIAFVVYGLGSWVAINGV